jgi:hypothetical protein
MPEKNSLPPARPEEAGKQKTDIQNLPYFPAKVNSNDVDTVMMLKK